MNIAEIIKNYQNNLIEKKEKTSIFLDLADEIIANLPYRLNNKTYLLIPDQEKELMETAYEYYFSKNEAMPISLTLKISEIMKKFNEVAQKLGFTVITKMSDYHNDGQLFDLLGIESINKGLIEEEAINLPNVKVPLTLSVDDYLKNIFLPVVFKNSTANRGEDKYLIETKEQLKKIISLFELPESKEINLKSEFVVQEYVKSFEGVNSSIRVFTSCTGDILSSLFLVSMDKTPKKRIKNFGINVFNPCEYLNDPNSPYYLNAKSIISNAAGGGRVIPLNKETSNLSANDEIMLTLHEINIDTLDLPKTIVEQCKEISTFFGSKKGIVLGIDFIYNSNDDNWYYLETNRNPSVEGYRRYMNLNGYLKKDVKSLMHLDSLTKIVENIMTKDMTENKTRSK
ncbi:MAG: hypothetical protein PHI05_01110 [Bacilli bacterium]|nr:hypothetical protein [Bacilli bacterium]